MAEKDDAYKRRRDEFLETLWTSATTIPEFAHGVVGKTRGAGNLSARGMGEAADLPEDALGVWYYDSGDGTLKFGDTELKKVILCATVMQSLPCARKRPLLANRSTVPGWPHVKK